MPFRGSRRTTTSPTEGSLKTGPAVALTFLTITVVVGDEDLLPPEQPEAAQASKSKMAAASLLT
jgi:hypothetical protein